MVFVLRQLEEKCREQNKGLWCPDGVLALTLFSIFFSMMLKQATEDLVDDDAVYIHYRLDSSLFNLRRL